jgi:hypothetical protein
MDSGATRESRMVRNSDISMPPQAPLQMLQHDIFLQVEMGSNEETKRTWKIYEYKKLSKTLYMHCSEEMFSVRSLSAATMSDTSD